MNPSRSIFSRLAGPSTWSQSRTLPTPQHRFTSYPLPTLRFRPISCSTSTSTSPSLNPTPALTPTRSFSSTPSSSSASLTNVLASDDDPTRLSISKFTTRGFHLTDDLVIPGGLILIDNQPFLWNVNPPKSTGLSLKEYWEGWGKEAFGMFEVVLPRPEMILFGTGKSVIPPPKEIKDYISSLGIQLEVMDSRNAASTFNMLQEEGRRVALAVCPVLPIDPKTGSSR